MTPPFLPGSSSQNLVLLASLSAPAVLAVMMVWILTAIRGHSTQSGSTLTELAELSVLAVLSAAGIAIPAIPVLSAVRILTVPAASLAPTLLLFACFLILDRRSGRRPSVPVILVPVAVLAAAVLFWIVLPGSWTGNAAYFLFSSLVPILAAARRDKNANRMPRWFLWLSAGIVLILSANDFAASWPGVPSFSFGLLPAGLALLALTAGLDVISGLLTRILPPEETWNPAVRDIQNLNDESRRILADLSETAGRYILHTGELSVLFRKVSRGLSQPLARINSLDLYLKTAGVTARNRLVEFQNRLESLYQEKDRAEQNAQTLETIAGILEEIANKGKVVSSGVVNLTSIIDSAKKNTDKSYQIIHGIRDDMNSIESFSQTIEKISEDANTLAMSAAIESAGAACGSGAGSGFQVVSQDLRELSARIKDQTVQIQTVLRSLKSDLDCGIRSTESVREFFLDIQVITDKIFGLILNIVNEAGYIQDNIGETRENVKSLASVALKLAASYDRSRQLSERLIAGMENSRTQFYQITMLLSKVQGLSDAWAGAGSELSRKNTELVRSRAALTERLESADRG